MMREAGIAAAVVVGLVAFPAITLAFIAGVAFGVIAALSVGRD